MATSKARATPLVASIRNFGVVDDEFDGSHLTLAGYKPYRLASSSCPVDFGNGTMDDFSCPMGSALLGHF